MQDPQFAGISLSGKSANISQVLAQLISLTVIQSAGIFKLASQSFTWKNENGSETVEAINIQSANWIRTGIHFMLELIRNNEDPIAFDGFREQVSLIYIIEVEYF
jgi:hypothetical protein